MFFSVQLLTVNFLELKPLTAEQLSAVVELDKLCFGELWTLDGYKRELESPNSDLLIMVRGQSSAIAQELSSCEFSASNNATFPPDNVETIVGLCCLWAILEEAHITILAVHPEYRGLGLGQAMLYALLKSAWERGLEWATLEVRTSNQAARSLYEKFGFEEVGRRRHYYKDTGEDALILWRGGLQKPEFKQTLSDWYFTASDRLAASGFTFSVF